MTYDTTPRDQLIADLLASYRQTAKAFMESTQLLVQQESDLNASAVFLLRQLADRGELPQHDTARFCGVTDAAISRQVAICRRKGYVRTRRDDSNRRKVYLSLTPDGRALVERVDAVVQASFLCIFQSFSSDQITQMIENNQIVQRAIES